MHSAPANIIGFGRDTSVRELMKPLAQWLTDDAVTEIAINKPGVVFVEIGPKWHRFEIGEMSMDRCMRLANAIATFSEQEISPRAPIMSAMLPDGERIQIVVPPAVEHDHISITIRRPSRDIRTLDEYESSGAFGRYLWGKSKHLETYRKHLDDIDARLVGHLESNRLADFLRLAVRGKKNIAVVGDTGSGKTTLMKSICQYIAEHERLISIEDVRELFLPHDNRVHLLYSKGGQGVAKVTPTDLIASNMRMKPDRVLLAELRGGEAFDFLKLLTTGHSGSITSYHAESCALAAERYVFMCKENDQAAIYDAKELKRLVSLTIDIIIHVVSRVVYDDAGQAVKKERFVAEVHFDPVGKLMTRFANADIHHA